VEKLITISGREFLIRCVKLKQYPNDPKQKNAPRGKRVETKLRQSSGESVERNT
jgi:hypothetical protein